MKKDVPDNNDILIAAASRKENLKRLLTVSIIFIVTIGLVVFFLVSNGHRNSRLENPELSEEVKGQENPREVNETPEELDAVLLDYEIRLRLRLEEIAENGRLAEKGNMFSAEAESLLVRFDIIIAPCREIQEPPEPLSLRSTIKEGEELIATFDATFEQHLARINESFAEKDYQKLERNLASAMLMAPSDKRLQRWNNVVPVARELFRQFERAKVAELEKDYAATVIALSEIKKMGYADDGIDQKIREFSLKAREAKRDQLVISARKNRDEGDFAAALQNIEAAQKVFPDKNDLEPFKREMREKVKSMQVLNWKKDGARAAAKDDWQEALYCFNKALEFIPTDKESLEGKRLATEILRNKEVLRGFKEKPLRLTDSNVSQYANGILKESSLAQTHSPSLARLRLEVIAIMEDVLRPREVVINSDGKTRIEVKGVGFVEPTTEKTIQLRPGDYIIHAACPGHKTNLTQLEIPASGPIKAQRIVCGARI